MKKAKKLPVTPTDIFRTRMAQYLPAGWRALCMRTPDKETEIQIKLTCAWYNNKGLLTCQDVRGVIYLDDDIHNQIKELIRVAKPEMKLDKCEAILIGEDAVPND